MSHSGIVTAMPESRAGCVDSSLYLKMDDVRPHTAAAAVKVHELCILPSGLIRLAVCQAGCEP